MSTNIEKYVGDIRHSVFLSDITENIVALKTSYSDKWAGHDTSI
jgi:hypothetical protein